jgi:hypothetical protein
MRSISSALRLARIVRRRVSVCTLVVVFGQIGLIASTPLALCCVMPQTAEAAADDHACTCDHEAGICPMHRGGRGHAPHDSSTTSQMCDRSPDLDMIMAIASGAPAVTGHVEALDVPLVENKLPLDISDLELELHLPPATPPPRA